MVNQYSYDRTASAPWAEAKIVMHPDLENLADDWERTLRLAQQVSEEDPMMTALYEAGSNMTFDISFLEGVLQDLKKVEAKWDRELDFAVKAQKAYRRAPEY